MAPYEAHRSTVDIYLVGSRKPEGHQLPVSPVCHATARFLGENAEDFFIAQGQSIPNIVAIDRQDLKIGWANRTTIPTSSGS
jgi:hypothetical protein